MPRPNRQHRPSAEEPAVPPRLADDLRRLYRTDADVPESIHDELLHQARTDLGNLKRARRWGGIAVVAAAAMIVFAFQIVLRQAAAPGPRAQENRTDSPVAVAAAPREDIDGNGRVDILDAFSLARRLDDRVAVDPAWDVNGDGAVDQGDIDAIAHVAVRLKGDA